MHISRRGEHKFAEIMRSNVLAGTRMLPRLREFKSPLAHANEMTPALGFYLPGWGSFASEVLEKVLRAMCEWFRTATETVLSGSVR